MTSILSRAVARRADEQLAAIRPEPRRAFRDHCDVVGCGKKHHARGLCRAHLRSSLRRSRQQIPGAPLSADAAAQGNASGRGATR